MCHSGPAYAQRLTLCAVRWRIPTLGMRRTTGVRGGAVGLPAAPQPWSRVVFPQSTGAPGVSAVWDVTTAKALPSVARASAIYTGMISQLHLDDVRNNVALPRPALLAQPDPTMSRTRFVHLSIEDYLLNGNALSYIAAYDASGRPSAVAWIAAAWVSITMSGKPYPDDVEYWAGGVKLDRDRLIHIRRGADRNCVARGVGVVEQHLATLDRIGAEEAYEKNALSDGAVPSVAVITPNPRLQQGEADSAKTNWLAKFARREPAILPSGTQVIPLSWSPADSELQAARQFSLIDVSNIFNLDGYWLGAPTAGSLTYRSPGQQYTALLRVSLEPVMSHFEDAWSMAWLPRGRRVRFDRLALTRDDLHTMMATLATGVAAQLITVEEGRVYLGLPPDKPVPGPYNQDDTLPEGAA
jgi:HK97 family phage portal protein